MRSRRLFRPLAAIAACLAAPLLGGAGPLTDNLATRVLAAHNRERGALGLPLLKWSEALATGARTWAGHLATVGYIAHSDDDPGDPDPHGENLWAGTRARYSIEQMIDLWLAERLHFRNGRFPDNATTGELEDVGHYTQVVWRTTAAIGCGIADNGADEYLVCYYAEAGNVIGMKPF